MREAAACRYNSRLPHDFFDATRLSLRQKHCQYSAQVISRNKKTQTTKTKTERLVSWFNTIRKNKQQRSTTNASSVKAKRMKRTAGAHRSPMRLLPMRTAGAETMGAAACALGSYGGGLLGGDTLSLQMRVGPDGRVEEAVFKTFESPG